MIFEGTFFMWFRIWILTLGSFALSTDGFVIAGILPDIAHSVGVSVATAGLLVTAFSLTIAIGSPILATLTGNVPRRRLLLITLVVFIAANILAALSPNYAILMVARILAAVGVALYIPTAVAIAAALAPVEKRGRALAVINAGLTIALALGLPIGTYIGKQFHWQTTFLVVAAVGIVAFLGILILFPSVANPPTVGLSKRLSLLGDPAIVVTLLTTALAMTGFYTTYPYLSVLLQNVTHLNGTGISVMLLLFGIAGALGNLVGGYGTDHVGAVKTVGFGVSMVAIALLLLPLTASSIVGAAIPLAVWGLTGWMLTPPQQHRLVGRVPQSAPVVISLNASAIYIGTGLGAAIGGQVLSFMPITAPGWAGFACEVGALGALLLSAWLMNRNREKKQPEPELATSKEAVQN